MGRIIRNHKTTVGAVMLLACTLLAVAALAAPAKGDRGSGERLWLSHFVGDQVVVTFAVPPPEMERTVKAQLMDAESPGVVLKLGGEEIFFSFANIISVEPVRK